LVVEIFIAFVGVVIQQTGICLALEELLPALIRSIDIDADVVYLSNNALLVPDGECLIVT
jgi:hypothetical protein